MRESIAFLSRSLNYYHRHSNTIDSPELIFSWHILKSTFFKFNEFHKHFDSNKNGNCLCFSCGLQLQLNYIFYMFGYNIELECENFSPLNFQPKYHNELTIWNDRHNIIRIMENLFSIQRPNKVKKRERKKTDEIQTFDFLVRFCFFEKKRNSLLNINLLNQ